MAPTSKIFETGAMKMEPGLSGLQSENDFTADYENEDFLTTTSAHGLAVGDPVMLSTSDTLPAPLAEDTVYYAIPGTETDEVFLATNRAHAIAGVEIELEDNGTGTHTLEVWAVLTDGWGGTTGVQTLGANDAFPWLTFGSKLNVATEKDASVRTKAFELTPRMVGKTVDSPLSFHARYLGLNRFHYWMWGFENLVKTVVAFKCSSDTTPFTAQPTPGQACSDGTVSFTYLRTETVRNDKIYVFEAATTAPALQTGTLTESGTTAWTMAFTSHSGLMYEHIYELDSVSRHLREYTTAELAVLTTLTANDRRNLMATFGKRMAEYDLRYQNSVCKNFSLKCSAAGMASYDCNYMGYTEARGDYSSSAWTMATGLDNAAIIPAHFELRFSVGETLSFDTQGALSGLTELGMSDININVETPLQALQTFISGLSLAEPVLEDPYSIKVTGTIARHSAQTYQTYRDSQTKLVAHLTANQGWYMQEWMIKEATLSESGADDGNVAAEPLALEVGYVGSGHQFEDWLYDVTELQDSPIVFRVRDNSPYNEMIKL